MKALLGAILDRLEQDNLSWHPALDTLVAGSTVLDGLEAWDPWDASKPHLNALCALLPRLQAAFGRFKTWAQTAAPGDLESLFIRLSSSEARKALISFGVWAPRQMHFLTTAEANVKWPIAFLETNPNISPEHLEALGHEAERMLYGMKESSAVASTRDFLIALLDAGWQPEPAAHKAIYGARSSMHCHVILHRSYPLAREDLRQLFRKSGDSLDRQNTILRMAAVLAQPGRTLADAQWLLKQTCSKKERGEVKPIDVFLTSQWARDLWPQLWELLQPWAIGWLMDLRQKTSGFVSGGSTIAIMVSLADPSQYRQLWEAAGTDDIRGFLLKLSSVEHWVALVPEEVEPLVQHADGEVRQKAILAMGFAGEAQTPARKASRRKRAENR